MDGDDGGCHCSLDSNVPHGSYLSARCLLPCDDAIVKVIESLGGRALKVNPHVALAEVLCFLGATGDSYTRMTCSKLLRPQTHLPLQQCLLAMKG